jgi:hypothetical protein
VTYGLAHLSAKHILGFLLSFVQEEGSFHLVLTFFVSWRSRFDTDIPAVVVYVSGVDSSVGCLRFGLCKRFIKETLSDQKLFLGLVKVFIAEEFVGF